MSLSNAQVRTLEAITRATDSGSAFFAPKGPSSRPAKFLKNTGLAEERAATPGGLWITDAGRAELQRQKNGTTK